MNRSTIGKIIDCLSAFPRDTIVSDFTIKVESTVETVERACNAHNQIKKG